MPNYNKTIICLANSRKMSGRCIAGKIYQDGAASEWVRPVSARDHEEISEEDRRYENGDRADLLDIIRIPMLEPRPHTYQTENHLIDDQYYWTKEGRAGRALLTAALDNHLTTLWENGYSSYSGINDRVPLGLANVADSSLALIAVDQVSVMASAEGADFGDMKRKVRAKWTWKGNQYAIRVTDPMIEQLAFSNPDKNCDLGSAYVCVSLGEPLRIPVMPVADSGRRRSRFRGMAVGVTR